MGDIRSLIKLCRMQSAARCLKSLAIPSRFNKLKVTYELLEFQKINKADERTVQIL